MALEKGVQPKCTDKDLSTVICWLNETNTDGRRYADRISSPNVVSTLLQDLILDVTLIGANASSDFDFGETISGFLHSVLGSEKSLKLSKHLNRLLLENTIEQNDEERLTTAATVEVYSWIASCWAALRPDALMCLSEEVADHLQDLMQRTVVPWMAGVAVDEQGDTATEPVKRAALRLSVASTASRGHRKSCLFQAIDYKEEPRIAPNENETDIDRLREENMNLFCELRKTAADMDSVKEEIKAMTMKKEENDNQMKDLKKRYQEQCDADTLIHRKLSEATTENERLQGLITAYCTRISGQEELIKRLTGTEDIESARQQCDILQEQKRGIEELTMNLKHETEEKNRFSNHMKRLEDQVQRYEEENGCLSVENKKLQSSLETLSTLKEEMHHVLSSNDALKLQVTELEKTNENLNLMRAHLAGCVEQLENPRWSLPGVEIQQYGSVGEELTSLEMSAENQRLLLVVDHLRQDIRNLQEQVEQADARFAALSEDLADEKRHSTELTSQARNLTRELTDAHRELERIEAVLALRMEALEQETLTVETLTMAKIKLMGELEASEHLCEEKSRELTNKSDQIVALKKELQEERIARDRMLAESEELEVSLRKGWTSARIAELEKQVTDMLADGAGEITFMKGTISKYEAQISEMKEMHAKHAEALDQQTARGSALQSQLSASERELRSGASRITELHSVIEDQKSQNQSLEARIIEKNHALIRLEGNIQDLERKLESHALSLERERHLSSKYRSEAVQVESELRTILNLYREAEKHYDTDLRDNIRHLKEHIRKLEAERSALKVDKPDQMSMQKEDLKNLRKLLRQRDIAAAEGALEHQNLLSKMKALTHTHAELMLENCRMRKILDDKQTEESPMKWEASKQTTKDNLKESKEINQSRNMKGDEFNQSSTRESSKTCKSTNIKEVDNEANQSSRIETNAADIIGTGVNWGTDDQNVDHNEDALKMDELPTMEAVLGRATTTFFRIDNGTASTNGGIESKHVDAGDSPSTNTITATHENTTEETSRSKIFPEITFGTNGETDTNHLAGTDSETKENTPTRNRAETRKSIQMIDDDACRQQ